MPIEIRELIIRTEISVSGKNNQPGAKDRDLNLIKRRLLEECKRMIAAGVKRDSYKR
jgi:hypothetical protein